MCRPRFRQSILRWTGGPIIGMRDRLIHGYEHVDYDIVWEAVQRDLPDLLEKLDTLIEQMGGVSEEAT